MLETYLAVVKDQADVGISLRRLKRRLPARGEVLVRPVLCGICGSDLKSYAYEPSRRRILEASMPVVLGHELAGEVLAVGSDVDGVAVGDRVTLDPISSCGHCRLCREGRPHICEARSEVGYRIDGCMAELAIVPARSIVQIPDGVSWAAGALLEPLAVAMHAAQRAGAVVGLPCAIVGPGPIGVLLLQVLRAAGASTVAMYGRPSSAHRLDLAREMGADVVVEVESSDRVSAEESYEVVFEAAGTPSAMELAARLVRRGGTLIYMSGTDQPLAGFEINSRLKTRGVDLLTVTAHPQRAWERALTAVQAGIVDVERIVTRIVSLEEVEAGFASSLERKELKVLVSCEPR